MEKENTTTIEKKEDFNFSPIVGAILVIGLLYFVFGNLNNADTKNTNSIQQNTNNNYWIAYSSPSADFSVSLPSNPEYKTYNFPVPDTDLAYTQEMYTSKIPGYAFLISKVSYSSPIDVSNPDNLLNGSLSNMLNTDSGNSLVSSEFSNFKGNRSLDFLMETKSFGTFIKGKIILSGQIIYLLNIESETSSPENYEKFINSFQIQ